ncbi:MAG: hypothetical protein LBT40_17395 [Deltaproteobacteria bacterium]|jgi:hypothetical protein|nr:hypothetical protein [Deltaproteobacteria bacterium]
MFQAESAADAAGGLANLRAGISDGPPDAPGTGGGLHRTVRALRPRSTAPPPPEIWRDLMDKPASCPGTPEDIQAEAGAPDPPASADLHSRGPYRRGRRGPAGELRGPVL